MRFLPIAYHDYESVAIDLAERDKLAKDLGDREVMLLRMHGVLVASASIAQAFNAIYWFENACRIQRWTRSRATPNCTCRRTRSSGRPPISIGPKRAGLTG